VPCGILTPLIPTTDSAEYRAAQARLVELQREERGKTVEVPNAVGQVVQPIR